MTDNIVKSGMFYFICATLDITVSAICFFTEIAVEKNPLWNWLTPLETLVFVGVLFNLVFCLFAFFISYILPMRYVFARRLFGFFLCFEGTGRLVYGVVPGLLLMKGAGWF